MSVVRISECRDTYSNANRVFQEKSVQLSGVMIPPLTECVVNWRCSLGYLLNIYVSPGLG